MSKIQLNRAYADWINETAYDLFITLNTEVEYTYTDISELISKLFYKAECDVFTYRNRERYRKTCRIKRVVAIENYKKRTHAHIQVKTLDNFTNEQMIELLNLEYKQLTNTKHDKAFLFNASVIANRQAVSNYITKEILITNKQQSDVIDLQSSFIS